MYGIFSYIDPEKQPFMDRYKCTYHVMDPSWVDDISKELMVLSLLDGGKNDPIITHISHII